jgi:hypothetical protein
MEAKQGKGGRWFDRITAPVCGAAFGLVVAVMVGVQSVSLADVPTAISSGASSLESDFLDFMAIGIPIIVAMAAVGFGIRWLLKVLKRGSSTV